jgi:hypothetical protein
MSEPESDDLCDFTPPENPDGSVVEFRHAWRTETVRTLARYIRAKEAFDRMAVLADALEEAGCDHPVILNHCRLCPIHCPDCWVIGFILPPDPLDELPEPAGPVRQAVDRLTDRVIQRQWLMIGIGVILLLVFGVVAIILWMFPDL